MSIDCHVKIEGIESESEHKDHKGEIDANQWEWGAHVPAEHEGTKGKAIPDEFSFSHRYDKASPVIDKYCASGKHFPTVTVTCRQAGEGQKDFLTVKMAECLITRTHVSAMSDGGIGHTVHMRFKKIDFDYKPMDDKGTLGGSVKFGWDAKTTEVT